MTNMRGSGVIGQGRDFIFESCPLNYDETRPYCIASGILTGIGQDHQRKQKTQDAFANLSTSFYTYFAVFDGHGAAGSEVSDYLSRTLLPNLNAAVECEGLTNEVITRVFLTTNTHLNKQPFNTQLSGSTAIVAVLDNADNRVVIASLGDSRCFVGSAVGISTAAKELGVEHKLESPSERKRIVEAGGRVASLTICGETMGPLRIWKQDEDTPGLSMSRAFGDTVAHELGVIAKPEITQYTLKPEDQWLVLCSDGVTEFSKCMEIAKAVRQLEDKGLRPDDIARDILQDCQARWQQHEHGTADDCTLTVLYLRPKFALGPGEPALAARPSKTPPPRPVLPRNPGASELSASRSMFSRPAADAKPELGNARQRQMSVQYDGTDREVEPVNRAPAASVSSSRRSLPAPSAASLANGRSILSRFAAVPITKPTEAAPGRAQIPGPGEGDRPAPIEEEATAVGAPRRRFFGLRAAASTPPRAAGPSLAPEADPYAAQAQPSEIAAGYSRTGSGPRTPQNGARGFSPSLIASAPAVPASASASAVQYLSATLGRSDGKSVSPQQGTPNASPRPLLPTIARPLPGAQSPAAAMAAPVDFGGRKSDRDVLRSASMIGEDGGRAMFAPRGSLFDRPVAARASAAEAEASTGALPMRRAPPVMGAAKRMLPKT